MTTRHEALAADIFSELTAIMGPLHSGHLARDLQVGDVLDAVHIATDDDETRRMRITFAPDTTHDTFQAVLNRLPEFAVIVTDTDGDTSEGHIAYDNPADRLILVRDRSEPDRSSLDEIPYDNVDTIEIA